MDMNDGRLVSMKSMLILFLLRALEFSVALPLLELGAHKLLHRPNKSPPVITIQSADGDLIDCVHFAHQPAFHHPLLRNHSFQRRPGSHPEGVHVKEKLAPEASMTVRQTWHMNGSCPQHTIPIRRTTAGDVPRASSSVASFGKKRHGSIPTASTMEFNPDADTGHEHAIAYVKDDEFYGAKAQINVWKPNIENQDEFSLSQIWVLGGSFSDNLNSIEAGWQVNPDLYGDSKTRLFTYWTTDAYKSTGCYNLLCSGFVQTSNHITLGGSIAPVSKYQGSQYQITLQIWKDEDKGNWWLQFGKDELVGYWPGEMFSKLKDGGASMIEWGGEVVDMKSKLDGTHTKTQMGSGHFPKEGYKMSSYFSNIKVVDHSNHLKDPKHLHTFVTDHRCYNVKIDDREEKWGSYFFYGGPGKNPDCP